MLPINLSTALLALIPLLAPIVHARTDLEGCVSSQTVAYGGASLIWYVPGTGEICSFLDCGGGRAPPKTTVPGCAAYAGTGTYEPSYLPGYAATGMVQATSTSMSVETGVQGVVTPSVDASTVTAAPEVISSMSMETTESTPTTTPIADLSSSTFFAPGVAETGSSSAAIESSTAPSSSVTSSAFTSTTTSSTGAVSILAASASASSASAPVSGARSSARSSSSPRASVVASSTGATQNSDAQRMVVGGVVGVLWMVGVMMML